MTGMGWDVVCFNFSDIIMLDGILHSFPAMMLGVSPPSQLHSSDVIDTPISDEMDMTELPRMFASYHIVSFYHITSHRITSHDITTSYDTAAPHDMT